MTFSRRGAEGKARRTSDAVFGITRSRWSTAVKCYSILNASTGLMDAARRAGISPAIDAATPSVTTATVKTPASTLVTSYSCDFTKRTHSNATGTPIASPSTAWIIAPRITIAITPERSAPSAMRMPISAVRRTTVYAVTP